MSTDDDPGLLAIVLALAAALYLLSWSIAGSPFGGAVYGADGGVAEAEQVAPGDIF